jgi:hypothetical protein
MFKTNKLHAVAPILALTIGGFAGSLAAGTDTTISAGKLARNAKDYYGKSITVKAEVEDVIDNHSFTLDEDAILTGADVLVLVPAGYTATLSRDQVVMVTGRVRPYVATELDRDYDWFDDGKLVTRETKVDFKTRPVLIADSLRTADGRELLTTGAMSTTDAHVHHAKMADHDKMKGDHKHDMKADRKHDKHDMMLSAGKLAKDGKKYYGRTVTVRAEVEDVLDSHSFTLDEDAMLAGADVVVLVPAGFDTSTLRKDEIVVVTGKVRQYVAAELERDFDWFKNGKIVTSERKIDYETRPVLVADSIRTLDGREVLRVVTR